jgi:hypothetical protein
MTSLNDVCFERIRDTFYYGMFGEFKLVVDKKTGCFNATKLCNEGGKQFKEWTKLATSKRMLAFYEDGNRGGDSPLYLYTVCGGNKDKIVAKTTGQYVRQELLLDIASWISIEFYHKCNRIIIDFFIADYKRKHGKIVKEKDDEIKELLAIVKRMNIKLDDMADKNDELLERNETIVDQNNRLETRVVSIQTKLDIAVEDRAPQPDRVEAREHFILLKRTDDDYPYYTIRAQEVNARNALRRQEQLYDETTVLLDIHLHPNSKTLYVRIKDDLRARGVAFRYCKISIEESDVTEAELVEAMRAINDEKRRVD